MKKTHTFETQDNETETINKAFETSGFRNKSEFVRHALFYAISELYGYKND